MNKLPIPETASEMPMMRKFMVESVLYWMKEYHIVAVAQGEYTVVAENGKVDTTGLRTIKGKHIDVPPYSSVILVLGFK